MCAKPVICCIIRAHSYVTVCGGRHRVQVPWGGSGLVSGLYVRAHVIDSDENHRAVSDGLFLLLFFLDVMGIIYITTMKHDTQQTLEESLRSWIV